MTGQVPVIIIISYVLKLCLPLSFTFISISLFFFLLLYWLYGKQHRWWRTWPLPSPSLPSLLCFLPQESSYPSTWHRTLLGRPGKEQLQASALQSSVSACTLFSSVHCLMSHASHVRCWARLFWQAVNPWAIHTGDPQNLRICCLLAPCPTHTFTLSPVKLKVLSGFSFCFSVYKCSYKRIYINTLKMEAEQASVP